MNRRSLAFWILWVIIFIGGQALHRSVEAAAHRLTKSLQVVREWQLEEVEESGGSRAWRHISKEVFLAFGHVWSPCRYTIRGLVGLCWLVSSFFVVLDAYIQSHLLLGLDASLDAWRFPQLSQLQKQVAGACLKH